MNTKVVLVRVGQGVLGLLALVVLLSVLWAHAAKAAVVLVPFAIVVIVIAVAIGGIAKGELVVARDHAEREASEAEWQQISDKRFK